MVKNWNIQGRSKIKKQENRQAMKREMRKILKETDINKFLKLTNAYFKNLEDEGENEFLTYLQK